MPKLFVDGSFKIINGKTFFCNSTQCVCVLTAYLKNSDLSLNVVDAKCDSGSIKKKSFSIQHQPECGFKIPLTCFSEVLVCSKECIPDEIASCNLPAILSDNNQFVISGLCHVLRRLIKDASFDNKNGPIKLLGHKKFCLKATSEICSRTNLCEIIGPTVIDEWNHSICIPTALLMFEKLLAEPVSIHNRDKKQRVILKQLTKSVMTGEVQNTKEPEKKISKMSQIIMNQKLKVQTNFLPPLEHVFAEGVELTLTDLTLIPLVHTFLNNHVINQNHIQTTLPNTLLWYKRVASISDIVDAANMADVTFLTVKDDLCTSEKFSLGNSEILKLASTNTNLQATMKKKELEKTIRRDLPLLLQKIVINLSLPSQEFLLKKIALDWKSFPVEVHPIEGQLSSKRASRKCHQIENLVYAVKAICQPGDVIVDFCAGGGHFGIVMAFLFPACRIVIVDNKEESLERARQRIDRLGLNNTLTYQCNLEHYSGPVNIGVALHACGVATDMVLRKCLKANASFVISPCCYGKISSAQNLSYPQSKFYSEADVDYDSFVLLGHAADQTSWDFEGEKPKQGKLCMELVDRDRLECAREAGYSSLMLTMKPRDCTPKNNLLIGASPTRGRLISNYELAT